LVAVLQFCSSAVLQFCSSAVLQFCSSAVLQFSGIGLWLILYFTVAASVEATETKLVRLDLLAALPERLAGIDRFQPAPETLFAEEVANPLLKPKEPPLQRDLFGE
jgi:hypothetical protein